MGHSALPGLLLPQPELHTLEVLIPYKLLQILFANEKPKSVGSIRNEGSE